MLIWRDDNVEVGKQLQLRIQACFFQADYIEQQRRLSREGKPVSCPWRQWVDEHQVFGDGVHSFWCGEAGEFSWQLECHGCGFINFQSSWLPLVSLFLPLSAWFLFLNTEDNSLEFCQLGCWADASDLLSTAGIPMVGPSLSVLVLLGHPNFSTCSNSSSQCSKLGAFIPKLS